MAVLPAWSGVSADGDAAGQSPRTILRYNVVSELDRANGNSYSSAPVEHLRTLSPPQKLEYLLHLPIRSAGNELCSALETDPRVGDTHRHSALHRILRARLLCWNYIYRKFPSLRRPKRRVWRQHARSSCWRLSSEPLFYRGNGSIIAHCGRDLWGCGSFANCEAISVHG